MLLEYSPLMTSTITALSQRQSIEEKLGVPGHPWSLTDTKSPCLPRALISCFPQVSDHSLWMAPSLRKSPQILQSNLVPEPHYDFTHSHYCFIPVSTQHIFHQPLAVLIGISRKRKMYRGFRLENR